MIGNQARVYRVKNAIKTAEKTKRILKDAGLNPGPVPTRLLLPILDACSVEDNNDLQERWAALLASASQEADLSPSFIETLKQLTPEEANILIAFSNGFPFISRGHQLIAIPSRM